MRQQKVALAASALAIAIALGGCQQFEGTSTGQEEPTDSQRTETPVVSDPGYEGDSGYDGGDSGYGDSDYGGQAAVEVPQQTPAQPAAPQTAPAAPAATDGDSAYDDGGDSGYGGASDYEGDD